MNNKKQQQQHHHTWTVSNNKLMGLNRFYARATIAHKGFSVHFDVF